VNTLPAMSLFGKIMTALINMYSTRIFKLTKYMLPLPKATVMLISTNKNTPISLCMGTKTLNQWRFSSSSLMSTNLPRGLGFPVSGLGRISTTGARLPRSLPECCSSQSTNISILIDFFLMFQC